MADTAEDNRTSQAAWLGLNSDGQRHPRLNAAAFFTLIVGLVSMGLGMYLRYGTSSFGVALAAGLTGLVCIITGLICQMISATREERILLVCGMVAGFIGLCMGLAHGGFS